MRGEYKFYSDTNEAEFCNELEQLGISWETLEGGVVLVNDDEPYVLELVETYGGMMVSG